MGTRNPYNLGICKLVLDAGDRFRLERLTVAILVRKHVAWRQHRPVFDNATLEEMAAEFNRYNQSVHLCVEGLGGDAHRFDGSFEATDPQSLIEMLSKEPDLTIERGEGEVVIRRR